MTRLNIRKRLVFVSLISDNCAFNRLGPLAQIFSDLFQVRVKELVVYSVKHENHYYDDENDGNNKG